MATDYSMLDNIIYDVGRPNPKCDLADASVFFLSLKKMAQEEPQQLNTASATPEVSALPVAAAEIAAETGTPDVTGQLEGKFTVPVEQAAMTMAQLVSQELKLQLAALYYGQMLREENRGSLANLLNFSIAHDALDNAKYLLRRIGVLVPGGVPVPVPPTPKPASDAKTILDRMISCVQQTIVLLKTLKSQLGDNPMAFTVDQRLSRLQEHLDELWQHTPVEGGETQMQPPGEKLSRAMKLASKKLSSRDVPKPGPGDVVLPRPGVEKAEDVVNLEKDLMLQQAMAENQFLANKAQQAERAAVMNQAQAESAAAEAALAQKQLAMVQEQADAERMNSQRAMEMAANAEENAAQQAEAKMRLSMRIQQMRQELADLVSQDPVQEEGVDFGEQADPGSPLTEAQQRQLQAQDPKVVKEMQQARYATQETQEQIQQAVEKAKQPKQPKLEGA